MSLYWRMYCPECKSYTLFTFPCKVPDFGFCKECEYVWSREIDGDEKNMNPLPLDKLLGIEEIAKDGLDIERDIVEELKKLKENI